VTVPDGAGGAIIAWYDARNTGSNIYAQRVDQAGVAQWTADGVSLCTTTTSKNVDMMIVSDGTGGAMVTWHEYRNGQDADIYAQRVSAAGVPRWGADGAGVCTAAGSNQYFPAIASDGAGGAIVAWLDSRSGPNVGDYAVHVQRVNAAGVPQWTADGVTLCTTGYFPSLSIVSDGAGGAVVAWMDIRSGTNYAVYAQRVNAAGVPQWAANGVSLCNTANPFESPGPMSASDGAGGAIVTWVDSRTGVSEHIYAQRVSASGAPQWTAEGVALCTAEPNGQNVPAIVSDGAGGAIVTWEDARSNEGFDIYAQRVSAAGAPLWTVDGVALCTAGNDQAQPKLVSEGAGGAIVTWPDQRRGINIDDIYAQGVSATGVPQWTTNGVALYALGGGGQPMIASDDAGGAIVTWGDMRPGIFAQRVYASGAVAAVPPRSAPASFQLLAPSPNPVRNDQLSIRFNMPSAERVSAEVLDLAGHRVRTLASDREFSAGPQVLGWDGKDDAGVRLPSEVYFVEVRAGAHAEARRVVLLH
jgi:hypothetical protein